MKKLNEILLEIYFNQMFIIKHLEVKYKKIIIIYFFICILLLNYL